MQIKPLPFVLSVVTEIVRFCMFILYYFIIFIFFGGALVCLSFFACFWVLPRPIKRVKFVYTRAIVSCTNTAQPPNNIYRMIFRRWFLDNVNPNQLQNIFCGLCNELTEKQTISFVLLRPCQCIEFVMR